MWILWHKDRWCNSRGNPAIAILLTNRTVENISCYFFFYLKVLNINCIVLEITDIIIINYIRNYFTDVVVIYSNNSIIMNKG